MSNLPEATLDLLTCDEDTTEVMELDGAYPPRVEKREPVVRIVEYSRYPRVERSQRRQIGFTRNQSRSGMCVVASEPEAEGTLLRVALRTVDGGGALDALAHVAWCERREDGRYWIGLALLERSGRRMLKVRRAGTEGATDRDRVRDRRMAGGDVRRWAGGRGV
jgi:hypothetical protein